MLTVNINCIIDYGPALFPYSKLWQNTIIILNTISFCTMLLYTVHTHTHTHVDFPLPDGPIMALIPALIIPLQKIFIHVHNKCNILDNNTFLSTNMKVPLYI